MNDEMTKESFAEMEENRKQMIRVKQWFQIVIAAELVFAIYMAGFSLVRTAGIIFAAAAVLYAFNVNKKDEKLCRIGAAGHIAAGLLVTVSSAKILSEILSLDPSGSSAAAVAIEGISHLTSVPAEELESGAIDMSIFIKGLKAAASVNLICAVLISVIPFILNLKVIKLCSVNAELSMQPGYPYFNKDIEFAQAVKKVDRDRRKRENADIKAMTGYERPDDDYYIYGDISPENSERYTNMLERFADRAEKDPDYLKEVAFKVLGIKYNTVRSKKRREMDQLVKQAEQMRADRLNMENYLNRRKNDLPQQNTVQMNNHNPDSAWDSTDLASSMLSDLDK